MTTDNGEPEIKIVSTSEELSVDVIAALRTVYDPEIPINVYDLGLVYQLVIKKKGMVTVHMSLTSPGSHLSYFLPLAVTEAINGLDGVTDCEVELVWDPPWTTDRVSRKVRRELHIPICEQVR